MKIKNAVVAGALALGLVMCPTLSYAELVGTDFRQTGDSALTLDTISSLEWLDLTYTEGISYLAITTGWDALITTERFRFATRNEIEDLVSHFGLAQSSDFLAANYVPALGFQDLLGVTRSGSNFRDSAGYYALGGMGWTSNGMRYSLASYHVLSTDRGDASVSPITLACVFSDCYANGHADYGAYLVREAQQMPPVAAVPEPETYAMMLAGLGLLGVFARRQKQNG